MSAGAEVSFPAAGSVRIALSTDAHDRAGERRSDDAWLEDAWRDPRSRVVPLADGRFPVRADDAVGWRGPAEAGPGRRMFLGLQHGVAHFAVLVDGAPESPQSSGQETPGTGLAGEQQGAESWTSLRGALQRLSHEDAGLMVHAGALAEWHRTHRYCPRCGTQLEVEQAGHAMICPGCGRHQFPRTDPAVIMLVTDGDRALLGRQPSWPTGRYSTLAGFVDPGESLEDAVVREVAEEAGVEVTDVTYFGNQPWPFPSSLMVGFFARAVTSEIHVDRDEISDARWFTREQMRAEAEAGTLVLPGGVSISRSLVEAWYGGELPGHW